MAVRFCRLNPFIIFRFGIKSVVLGSAVYYTIDKGVWKDSATTTALYEELEKGVSPYVGELKKQIPYEVTFYINSLHTISYDLWNIIISILFVATTIANTR